MHTVRSRIASRPPITTSVPADFKPPIQRSARQELTRMLRTGAPSAPQAPTPALALPAIPLTAAAWPSPVLSEGPACAAGTVSSLAVRQRADPAESRSQKPRNPKGKKARKAAGAATGSPRKAKERSRLNRGAEPKSDAMPPAAPPVSPLPQGPVPEVRSGALPQQCLEDEPGLALMLPSPPEPLVEAPELGAEPDAPVEAEPALAEVLTLAALPDLLVIAPEVEAPSGPIVEIETTPALTLPPRPEPLVEARTPAAQAAAAILPAAAVISCADEQSAPLPRSRALVPSRKQGLVDVIAFLLRDSGRRLARWSTRRQKSKAERESLCRAEAHQRALVSELEALDALRRNRD